MADTALLEKLLKGDVKEWNEWRRLERLEENHMQQFNYPFSRHTTTFIDLEGGDLSNRWLDGADLEYAFLKDANLFKSLLTNSNLKNANLKNASLREAWLQNANLSNADLTNADLRCAKLGGANLNGTNLSGAKLQGADLTEAILVRTDLSHANLSGCRIYGISAWDLVLEKTTQTEMVITSENSADITIDGLELAQFVYLLVNNYKVRDVINTVTSKVVLILGRFYDERKKVLDALKYKLREMDLVPIVFDFEPSKKRDLTETIQLLANMSKFVIADVTDAKSIPQELSHIIPNFPSVPVRPILSENYKEYAMFEHWESYSSVLPVFCYKNRDDIIENIEAAILQPIQEWYYQKDEKLQLQEKLKRLQEENEKLKNLK